MNRIVQKLLKNDQGVAAIEFILVLPLLLLLLYGSIELTRYILIVQKVEKAAYVMTDSVGRFKPATLLGQQGAPAGTEYDQEIGVTTIGNVALTLNDLMSPYDDDRAVIFTSILHTASGEKVRWQFRRVDNVSGGAFGPLSITGIGGSGPGSATLLQQGAASPATTTTCHGDAAFNANIAGHLVGMLPNENYIVGEVYFQYRPMIQALLQGITGSTDMTGGVWSIAPTIIHREVFIHPRNDRLWDLPASPQLGNAGPFPLLAKEMPCS